MIKKQSFIQSGMALLQLLLFQLFLSCNQVEKKPPVVNASDSVSIGPATKSTIQIRKESNALDTSKIISLIKMNPGIDKNSEFEILRLIAEDNGDKYLLVGASTGTCHRAYLFLLDNANSIKKCAELEANCDSDLSRASYRYKIYSEESDSIFNIEEITQTVADTSLIGKNGRLKNDYSLDDVDCRKDTVFKKITFSFLRTQDAPQWPKIWK